MSFTTNIGLSQRGVKVFLEDAKLVVPKNLLIIRIKQMITVLLKTNMMNRDNKSASLNDKHNLEV